MEDKLEEIFSLQKGLTEMMNLDRYPDDIEGRISALCTAMIHEAIELQRTTNLEVVEKTYGVQSSGS